MKKKSLFWTTVCLCFLALLIPLMLVIDGFQARKYADLEADVKALEEKENELVEENKKLITDISILSSTDRIEKIAQEDLKMRKAESEEIVRVEMKGSNK